MMEKKKSEWTQKHTHVAFSREVNGSWTQERQLETDWVSTDRCQQCRKEGSEDHRLYECVAHKNTPELPRNGLRKRAHSEAIRQTTRTCMRRHRTPQRKASKSEHFGGTRKTYKLLDW